ncbi:LFI-1 protein [Sesbania bispinosa]|nr:LFI-1 protein [Sesbania bispinosa]
MSSGDFDSGADPTEANSSSSFSALISDNPVQAENLVPVINVDDSKETESDLDSDLKENRNTPVYQTFLTEVYTFNSIYTTPASITKFRRRVPEFDYEDLSFDEKIDVAFLRNSAPLDCGFLLENEDLPDRLRQILDKMPPKATVPRTVVNEKAMRRWLKEAGGEPDGQNTGGNVNQSAVSSGVKSRSLIFKARISPSRQLLRPGQAGSSSLPRLGDKWWTLFNNFEGAEGSEVNSIFDHRFNVERVVSWEFNKKEDRTRVNKVGMRNVGKHLMTMGAQTAFLGYCFDSGMSSADKELKECARRIEELIEKLKALESSAQTINSLEKSLSEYNNKLTSAENDKKVAENDKKTAETKYKDLNTKYSDVVAQQGQLKKDLAAALNEKSKACEDLLAVTE